MQNKMDAILEKVDLLTPFSVWTGREWKLETNQFLITLLKLLFTRNSPIWFSFHNPFPKSAVHGQPSQKLPATYLRDPCLSIICITRCSNMSRLTIPAAQSNAPLQRGGVRLVVREDQLRKKQSTDRLRHGYAVQKSLASHWAT